MSNKRCAVHFVLTKMFVFAKMIYASEVAAALRAMCFSKENLFVTMVGILKMQILFVGNWVF